MLCGPHHVLHWREFKTKQTTTPAQGPYRPLREKQAYLNNCFSASSHPQISLDVALHPLSFLFYFIFPFLGVILGNLPGHILILFFFSFLVTEIATPMFNTISCLNGLSELLQAEVGQIRLIMRAPKWKSPMCQQLRHEGSDVVYVLKRTLYSHQKKHRADGCYHSTES